MSGLVRYEAARGALAAANSLDEVMGIRDKAEAMAAYARQAKDDSLIALATEIKVRAERRCGEMLRESERAKAGDNLKKGRNSPKSHDATSGPTLKEIGVTKSDSSRWQRMAALPEKAFETVVEVAKAQVGEVTSAAVLRAAKAAESPESHAGTPGKKATKPAATKAKTTKKAAEPEATSAPATVDDEGGPSVEEIAAAQREAADDQKALQLLLGADEPLAEAHARLKEQAAQIRILEERVRGLTSECAAAIRQAKSWRTKFEKLERTGVAA